MKFSYMASCLVPHKTLIQTGKKLQPYLHELQHLGRQTDYAVPESSIHLPFDRKLAENVMHLKRQKVTKKLKYIVVVGIGGSNLGTKAIYDAHYGFFDILEPERFPKMLFAETVDPEFLAKLIVLLKQIRQSDEVLINVISKSGTTTETTMNADIILKTLQHLRGIGDRVVVTTDFGSKLWKQAEQKNWACLAVPKQVGGRYSVFSAVGLFPLAAAGFNLKELLRGAERMAQQCLNIEPTRNPALLSAAVLFWHYRRGKNIHDSFFFHPELESLGKWYRQLVGESLGKKGLGLTPTVSLGSTDLHSVGQLYLGGPKDKSTTFISSNPPAKIMDAILRGVKIAYAKKRLPFMEIVLPDFSTSSLAEFMQFKMMEVIFLGKLLRVNAFDQPQVELYKKETKKILGV